MSKNPLTLRKQARKAVMQALYQWHMTENPPREIHAEWMASTQSFDRAYFDEIFLPIIETCASLDEYIEQAANRPISELSPIERSILRLSVYELCHRLDIPHKVILNEGIEIAKAFGGTDSYKMVNQVLDQVAQKARGDLRPL